MKYGWLYTKNMEKKKVLALNKSTGNYRGKINITDEIRFDILWWIDNLPLGRKTFEPFSANYVIYTDASDTGWGATDNTREIFGIWSPTESKHHINYKELLAVKLGLEDLGKNWYNTNILLRIDNSTAIAYINRMGGVKFEKYNILARKIWQWAERRNNFLKASYIPSEQNKDADRLSRIKNPDTEWELSGEAFAEITGTFGIPEIDLFANDKNTKCDKYYSWAPEPNAVQIDAFTVSWKGVFFYAFSPFCLVAQTLEKIRYEQAEGIIVVPNWHNQPWYPNFKHIALSKILILGPNQTLLLSPCRGKQHPGAPYLQLAAEVVSGKH